MCVDATVRAAVDLGFNTAVVHDACATCDLEFGGQVVSAAAVHAAFLASVVSTDEIVNATRGGPPPRS